MSERLPAKTPPIYTHVRPVDQVGHPFFDEVSRRVRGARLAAGWSRKRLAEETSITPAWRLAEKEYNRRPFTLIELRRISLVLGVEMSKFFEVDRPGNEDIWAVPLGEDEWYWKVTSPEEKHLLEAYRKMKGWQRRALVITAQSMQLAQETGALHEKKKITFTNPEQASAMVTESAKKLWPEGVKAPSELDEEDEGAGVEETFERPPEDAPEPRGFEGIPEEDLANEAALEAEEEQRIAPRSVADEVKIRRNWYMGQGLPKKGTEAPPEPHPLQGKLRPPRAPVSVSVPSGPLTDKFASMEAAAQARRQKEARESIGLEERRAEAGTEAIDPVEKELADLETVPSPPVVAIELLPPAEDLEELDLMAYDVGAEEDYGVADIGSEVDD